MGNSVHGAPPPANAHRHAWRTLPGDFCGEPPVQNQATAFKEAGRGANLYSAAIVRSEFVGKQLEQIASSHFDGAVTPMLHALVDHAKLSRKDRAAIRRIIDELDS